MRRVATSSFTWGHGDHGGCIAIIVQGTECFEFPVFVIFMLLVFVTQKYIYLQTEVSVATFSIRRVATSSLPYSAATIKDVP